eukprot:gene30456-40470_t
MPLVRRRGMRGLVFAAAALSVVGLSACGSVPLMGGKSKSPPSGENAAAIGVNGYLWRASLDTLSFMPLASADPYGGVIVTECRVTVYGQTEITRDMMDAREARGQRSVLIAVHSFTPVWQGKARPWHVGVLYHRDARLALALGAALEREPGTIVGYNEPYDVSDETDYSIPVHGEKRGLLQGLTDFQIDMKQAALFG